MSSRWTRRSTSPVHLPMPPLVERVPCPATIVAFEPQTWQIWMQKNPDPNTCTFSDALGTENNLVQMSN